MSSFLRKTRRIWKSLLIGLVILLIAWGGFCYWFRLSPLRFAKQGFRVAAMSVLAQVYDEDLQAADILRNTYFIGEDALLSSSPETSWERLESQLPGFRFLGGTGSSESLPSTPFVYESIDALHLKEFREQYDLTPLLEEASDEYDAMLRVGGWICSQWDHGVSPVPGGIEIPNPTAIIQAGQEGATFWCEVAAKVTVNVANALGWPARLATASLNGYTWNHAIAEFWSNQYRKWFMIDTDFNVVYEAEGVPLSVFELCHQAPEIQQTNQLHVRSIAPQKPSLPLKDLIPYYGYVHIDMRSDWYSRRLRRGSPAGGDLATWWTARPSFHPVLTAKVRVDEQSRFDWPVNVVNIHAPKLDMSSGSDTPLLHVGFTAYSPYFKAFQVSVDDKAWQGLPSHDYTLPLYSGTHRIKARIITVTGWTGPEYEVEFQFSER